MRVRVRVRVRVRFKVRVRVRVSVRLYKGGLVPGSSLLFIPQGFLLEHLAYLLDAWLCLEAFLCCGSPARITRPAEGRSWVRCPACEPKSMSFVTSSVASMWPWPRLPSPVAESMRPGRSALGACQSEA